MKIVVCTLNKAKNDAVRNVVSKVWKDVEFISIKTNSGISDQPMSDEESIQGAINRAKEGLQQIEGADYSIGLEGNVDENQFGMFLNGWAAIINKRGLIGLGCSGKVEIPKDIANQLREGKELGPLMQELMEDNSLRNNQGTNGVLTNGLYTRTKEFEDAVSCALAKFVNSEMYRIREE